MFINPVLIEPGTRYFLKETLKQCSAKKNHFYNNIFNISLFFGFLAILGTFLFYKHKTKLTPKEKENKKKTEQEYILTKLRIFNEEAQRKHNMLITNLPSFEKNTPITKQSHKILPNNYIQKHENFYNV